jgi:hypothetical protein
MNEKSFGKSFTVVKCTLNQFCLNDVINKKLNEHVLNCSKISFEAHELANLHVLRCLKNNDTVPSLNQDFFLKCIQYVSKMYSKNSNVCNKNIDLQATFDIYKQSIPETYKPSYRDYSSNIVSYMALQMSICTTNHLVLNFYKRFYRYMKDLYPDKNTYELVKNVYDKDYKGNDEVVIKYRTVLGSLLESNVKKNPTGILKVYNEILSYRLDKEKRTFSLLPRKKGFGMDYITIDKSILKDILADINGKAFDRNDFDSNVRTYWTKLFDIERFESKSKKFHSFLTDGVGVSVILERKIKRDSKEPTVINYEGKELIGLDPGMRMLFVGCIDNDKNVKNEIIKCSGKEYYHDVGVNKYNAKLRRRLKRNPRIFDYIKNIPSGKTNDIKALSNRLRYCLRDIDEVLVWFSNRCFRKEKFTRYVLAKKKLNSLCKLISKKNKINDPIKVVVGFGNWSNPGSSIIKGHRRGPVLKLKKELTKWCDVVNVDEFRTSKLCCKCFSSTERVYSQVNSVLRCKNVKCRNVIDRDVNGCKNILMILKSMLGLTIKPKEFNRSINSLYS